MASNGYCANNGRYSSSGGEEEEWVDLRRNGAHNDLDNKYNGFIMLRDANGEEGVGEEEVLSDPERDSLDEDNSCRNNHMSQGDPGSSASRVCEERVTGEENIENERKNGRKFQTGDEEEEDMEVSEGEEDLRNCENIRDSLCSDDIDPDEDKDTGTEKHISHNSKDRDGENGIDTEEMDRDGGVRGEGVPVTVRDEDLGCRESGDTQSELNSIGLNGRTEDINSAEDGQQSGWKTSPDQTPTTSTTLAGTTTSIDCNGGARENEFVGHCSSIAIVEKEGQSSNACVVLDGEEGEEEEEGQMEDQGKQLQQPQQQEEVVEKEGLYSSSFSLPHHQLTSLTVATTTTTAEQESVLVECDTAPGFTSNTSHISSPHSPSPGPDITTTHCHNPLSPPLHSSVTEEEQKEEEQVEEELQEDSFIAKRSSSSTETLELVGRRSPSPSPASPNNPADNSTGLNQGLSDNFVDYLSTRMERSNSEEEKRDAEKLSDVEVVDTACHGQDSSETGETASAAAPQETDNCCTNASEAFSADTSSMDMSATTGKTEEAEEEKDIDTADHGGVGPSDGDMIAHQQNVDDAGAASGEVDAALPPSIAIDSSSTLENNTAELISLEKDIDAADKDVSDEKGLNEGEEEMVEEEQGQLPKEPCTGPGPYLIEMAEKPEEDEEDQQVISGQPEEESQEMEEQDDGLHNKVEPPAEPEEEKEAVTNLSMQETNDLVNLGALEENATEEVDEKEDGDERVKAEEVQPVQNESSPGLIDVSQEEEEQQEEPAEPQGSTMDGIEPTPLADQSSQEQTLVDFAEPTKEEEQVEEKQQEAVVEEEEQEEKESDEEVDTFIEHPSPNVEEEEGQHVPEETMSQTVATTEETAPLSDDVVHADDKVEDGIESVQSISNIKTRFQSHDERPPMPGDRSFTKSTTPTNGHVNGDHTPPEVVNRSESQEEILERELPPANLTRNLASKFRDMESDSPSERKPVRKITPPREELARDVTYARESLDRDPNIIRSDESAEKEDERPPPSFTRNMLAKFKEMEDTTNPPPSPARSSAVSPTKRTVLSHQQFASHTNIRASPDEGIADTEPSTNGHRPEVLREADKTETEELPERGFTKSLLAQWRQIEQTAPAESAKSLAPRQTTPGRSAGPYRHASPSNSQDGDRDVVRETDTNEEEFLPPPSYTKNMLAKFQTLQDETASNQGSSSNKKQFKWEVREAKPLWGGVPSREQLTPEAMNGHEENGEVFSSDSEDDHEEYVDDIELECDEHGNPLYPINHPHHPDNVRRREEKRRRKIQRGVIRSDTTAEEDLPAPDTTRRLLSQFKSMEDVEAPVPTPERVLQQQKLVRNSISAQPIRLISQTSEEREQPDGTDDFEHTSPEEHYEDGGEYENIPIYREDVVRETDKDESEDLPEQGITRNLLAKFQSMQAV